MDMDGAQLPDMTAERACLYYDAMLTCQKSMQCKHADVMMPCFYVTTAHGIPFAVIAMPVSCSASMIQSADGVTQSLPVKDGRSVSALALGQL